MSLLRKIRRNILNAKRLTASRHNRIKTKAEKLSRISLEALEPRVLLAADLEASLMPADMLRPDWGDTIDMELNVVNNGTDLTSGTADVAFYMDANGNDTLDIGTDLEITSVTANTSYEPNTPSLPLNFANDNLPSTKELEGVYTLTLPSSGYTDGDYTIFVTVDGTAISDSDTTNNNAQFTIPIGLTAPTGIDVAPKFFDFDALDIMDELKAGTVYPVSIGVQNFGDTATSAAVNVSIFISPDKILTSDSILLTTDGTNPATAATTGALNAGTLEFVSIDVQMPTTNPFGTDEDMYLIAAVDATGISSGTLTGGAETETYESNNYIPAEDELSLVSTSSTSGVDLGAGFLWFGSTYTETVPNFTWGQTTGIPAANVGLYNAGDTDATAFDVEVKISPTEDSSDTNAVSLVSTTGAAVTATSMQYTTETIAPTAVPSTFGDASSPVGWAYAYAYLDVSSTNTDVDAANNISDAAKVWMGSFDGTNPDLSPYELDYTTYDDTGYFHWGDSIEIEGSIANVGTATGAVSSSAPVTVTYYLHDAADITDTASFTPISLGSGTVITDMDSGEIVEIFLHNITVDEPTTPSTDTNPSYQIVMSIDGGTAVATEASTTNNTLALDIAPYDTTLQLDVSTNAPFADWAIPPTMEIYLSGLDGLDLSANSVDVNFYLSSDTTLDTGSDDAVGTYTFNFDTGTNKLIVGGSPLTANYSLDFSGLSSPADGDYTIFATLSSPSGVSFPSTSGITESINMPIGDVTSVTGMDLSGDSVIMPVNSEIYWGGDLDLALIISNIGDTNITSSFDIQAYLSVDNVVDSSDISLGSAVTVSGGINALTTAITAHSVTLPSKTVAETAFGNSYVSNTSQTYQILFALDSGSAITEAYEYDNTFGSSFINIADSATVTPTGIDVAGQHFFSPTLMTSSSPSLEWGGSLTVYANFENIGPSDETAGFSIKYYLSPSASLPTDPTTDSSILELTSADTVASLTSGAVTNASFTAKTLTVPSAPASPSGSYYIIARAANVTSDTATTNNDIIMQKIDGNNMQVAVSAPDLVPDVEKDNPEFDSDVYWKFGGQYTLALDVLNDSSIEVSGSTTANIYISATEPDVSTLTISTLESDTATYTKLTSDQTITFSTGEFESINDVTVTLPSGTGWTDGKYYLIYAVDTGDSEVEVDETNNIEFIGINIASTSPIAGKTDIEMLDMEIEVDNAGDNDLTVLQLAWNTTYTGAAEHMLYNAGDAIASGSPSTFTVDYQLTTDGDYTSGTASLGTSTVTPPVDSLAIFDGTVDIVTPASGTNGIYYVVAKADSAGDITAEQSVDTDNNISDPFPLYIGDWATGVDLAAFTSEISLAGTNIDQDSYVPGDVITVEYQVANVGDTQAQAFTVEFYLSDDATADTGELITPTSTSPSNPGALNGSGSIMNMTATMTVPAPATTSSTGEYYLIVKVVPNGGDTDVTTTNNEILTSINVDLPDLAISSTGEFLLSPTVVDYVWGQTDYDVEIEFSNTGDGDAANFNVRLVLSADSTYDASSDIELSTFTVDKVAAGATYVNVVSIDIPEETSGSGAIPSSLDDNNTSTNTYYILAVLDSGDSSNSYAAELDEISTTNNISTQALTITDSSGITLQSGVADLQVIGGDFEVYNDEVLWGMWVPLEVPVYNDGNTAAGAFNIQFALSADTVWDGSGTDIILTEHYYNNSTANTTSWNVTSLAAGTYYVAEGMVRIPDYDSSYTETSYKIIAKIDSDINSDDSAGTGLGDVDETGYEDNNVTELDSNVTLAQPTTGTTDIIPSLLYPTWNTSSTYVSGSTITVVAGVTNYGDTSADPGTGAINADFYLVPSMTTALVDAAGNISSSAVPLTESSNFVVSINNAKVLPAGTGYEQNMTLTIPNGITAGTYYLAMMVDSTSAITETSNTLVNGEANNYMVVPDNSYAITIGTPQYDLEVADTTAVQFTDGAGTALTGSPVFTSEIGNIGLDITITNNGVSTVSYYTVELGLYSDQALTQLVAGTAKSQSAANLAGNGTATVSINGNTIPADLAAGTYYYGIKLDPSNVVDESGVTGGESNNTIAIPVTIESAAPVYDITIASTSDVQFTDGAGTAMPADPVFMTDMTSIGVSMNIANNGTSTTDPYQVKIGIYSDSALTTPLAGSETTITGITIDGNGTATLSLSSLAIPTITTEGVYYVGITLDVDNELDETQVTDGENNNVIAVPVTFEHPKSDIVMAYFKVADQEQVLEAAPGDTLQVHLELNNESQTAITTPFDVTVDLLDSTGAVVTGASWTQQITVLNSYNEGNNHIDVDFDIMLPFDLDIAGTYTLVAKADSGNVIVEAKEDNNASQEISLTLKNPEVDLFLQPVFIETPPEGKFFWGSELYFNFQLNEFGDSASPQSKAAIYLSSTEGSIEGATLLQELDIPELNPGSFYSAETYIYLPENLDGSMTDGQYYIVVSVDSDDQIDEIINGVSAEDNNIKSAAIEIGSPNIDLEIMQDSSTAGEDFEIMRLVPFDVQMEVFNDSLGVVDTPFVLRAVISQDSIAGNEDDYLLGEITVEHLDPYMSFHDELLVDLPDETVLPDGTYRVIITADANNVIDETYPDGTAAEDNNQSIFYINLVTPDLVEGVDLEAGDFDFEGMTNFNWGETYDVYYGLMNSGLEDAGEFNIKIALSKDNVYDSTNGDYLLADIDVAEGLTSGNVYMNQTTLTFPDNADGSLSDGPYFVIFVIDGDNLVTESVEDNNIINKVISMGNLPNGTDFEVGDVEADTNANYGDSFTIKVPVSNNGAQSAWGQLSVYVSSSPITKANLDQAMMIGSYTLSDDGDFGPGASTTIEVVIDMPTMPQDSAAIEEYYNVLFIVDANNDVEELVENNNSFYHTFILTQEKQADLEAWPVIDSTSGGSYIPGVGEAFDWGDELTLNAYVNNWGDADVADSFKITYYLSSTSPYDANFDSSGLYQLTSKTVSSIDAGVSVQVTGAVVVLPETAPDRFAGVNNLFIVSMVDSADTVEESNEDNNYSDLSLYIGSVPADLSGWISIDPEDGQEYPRYNYLWGETIPVSMNLSNFGGGDAENFTITYYLAEDFNFQNTDGSIDTGKLVEISSQTISLVSAGAGSWNPDTQTETEPVVVSYGLVLPTEKPSGFSDTSFGYNLVAMIDSGDTVTEYDEYWNNITTNYINIEQSISDLISFYVDPIDPATGQFKPDALWSDDTTVRQIQVRGNVENQGNIDVESIKVKFLLADSTGNIGTAYELGAETIENLTAMTGSTELSFTYDIPKPEDVGFVQSGAETGPYTIIMVIDPDDEIDESLEDNNIAMHPLRLTKQTGKVYVSDNIDDPSDKEMDFGKLLVDEIINGIVTIRNDGEGVLTVNEITSSNAAFGISGIQMPITIEPDGYVDINVEVNATDLQPGDIEGTLTIMTDDTRRPDGVVVDLAAEVAQSPFDLELTSVAAEAVDSEAVNDETADAYWGDTLKVDLSAANISDTDTANGVFVDIFLANSYDENADMYMLVEGYSIGDLLASDSTSVSLDIALPAESPFGYSGEIYVVAEIFGGIDDYEPEFDNNVNGSLMRILTKPEGNPDISFSFLNLPEELAPGMEVTVGIGLVNSGKADAEEFSVNIYVSDDSQFDSNDELLETFTVHGLSVDAEKVFDKIFTIPEDAEEGLKYLLVRADSTDVLSEDDETNNQASARFNIEAGPAVDFSITALTVDAELLVNEEFALGVTVANNGDELAEDVDVDFFLYPASSVSGTSTGTFIGSLFIDSIDAGSSVASTFQAFMPGGLVEIGSEYVIVATVDPRSEIEETDETNNSFTSSTVIPTVGSIDLTGQFGEVPAEATWGDGFDVTLTVTNQGEADASAFSVKVVLSADTKIDENDFYLSSWQSGGKAPGESTDTTLWAYLPDYVNLADGNYYVLAKIDNNNKVEETDETNNLVISSAIAVAGKPDLYGYLTDVPESANYGQSITVTDTVSNYGTAAAGEFEVTYYLSDDWEYNAGEDVKLGSRVISSLAAEGENTGSVTLELARPEGWPEEGQVHIVMVVDEANVIDEKYESGLVQADTTVEYSSMPVDILKEGKSDLVGISVGALAAESFEWTTDSANPETINIQYELTNNGTASAENFTISFYLSANTLITADKDYELGSITINTLEAEASLADFAEFVLPESSPTGKDGDFYIGMIIDKGAEVEEIDEQNNTATSTAAVAMGNVVKVDLVANDVYGPESGIVPDESFSVYAGVFNAGTEPSSSFEIDFYLTTSGSIDGTSIKIGSQTMDPVNAGSYSGRTFTFGGLSEDVLDGFVGSNAIFAIDVNPAETGGNHVLEESNYDNNQTSDFASTYISQPVTEDAVAVSFTSAAGLGDLTWGDSVSLSYTVTPISDAPLDVQIILKNSAVGNELVLSSFQLAGGDSDISSSITVTLPDTSPFGHDGNLSLVLAVDPTSTFSEISEANNQLSLPVTVGSGLSDLAAMDISTQPTASAGDSIEIYSGVANYGSIDAYGFEITYYLSSSNTVIDEGNDTMLTSVYISSLAGMEYLWNAPSITIPNDITDGSYYLAMQVDPYDDIEEASETNNVSFSYMPIQIKTTTVSPDSNEPDNQISSATIVTLTDGLSNIIEGTIHQQGNSDFFSFTTPSDANGLAAIEVIPDDYLNVSFTVYNQSGTAISTVDLEPYMGAEEIFTSFNISPGKTYYVEVEGVGSSLGEYELEIMVGTGGTAGDSYESNNTLANAAYIGSEDVTITNVNIHSQTDQDYYMFTVPGDSTGEFEIVAFANPELDLVMRLYDSDGVQIASSDNSAAGSEESLRIDAAAGSVYYVAFSSWAGSTGGYGFDIMYELQDLPDDYESNDTLETAYVLNGDSYIGLFDTNINISTDVDYYSVTVPSGYVSLDLNIYNAVELDSKVSVYSSSGRLLRSADRGGVGEMETLVVDGLTAGQELYIAVSSVDGTTGYYGISGSYSAEAAGDFAEPNESTASAYEIDLTNKVSVSIDKLSIHNNGDIDYYMLTLPANSDGTVTITATPDNSNALDLELRLKGSDGTNLKSADATSAGGVETLTYSSLVAGESYYVVVKGWDTTGDYKLSLSVPTSAAAVSVPVEEAGSGIEFISPLAAMTPSVGYLTSTSNGTVVIEQIGTANDDLLSFGTTSSGSTSTGTVSIRNTTSSSQDYTIAVTGDDAFTVSSSTVTIAAGAAQNVTVSFTPDATGSVSGTLTVTDGSSVDVASMPLSGTGTVTASKPDIMLVDSSSNEISSLKFATTEPEDFSEKTFRIKNIGSSNLTITSAAITGTNADVFSIVGNLAGRTVASGTPLTVRLSFEPLTTGNKTASLVLVTNDPDEPVVTIPLTATAGTADLTVSIDELDFNKVMVDGVGEEKESKALTLTNNGNTTLNITSFDFGNSDFHVTDSSGNTITSLNISAGSSTKVFVVFDPTVEGAVIDSLEFTSNDNDSPIVSLTADGITGYTTDPVSEGVLYFNDSDGDIFKITYRTSGDMTFTAETEVDDVTLAGSNLSIDVLGALGRGSIKITDTNKDAGDGFINIETLSIDNNFRLIDIPGTINELTIDGSLSTLKAGSVGIVDIAGLVNKMSFTEDLDTADISVGQVKSFVAGGDIVNSTLVSIGGSISKVNLKGDTSELDISSAGEIKSLKVKGDFIGDITAADSIGAARVGGSVTGTSWSVTSDSSEAQLKSLRASGGISIDSLLVEGTLKKLYSGSKNDPFGLAGSFRADSIGVIKIYGDLDAVIRSDGDIRSWSLTGGHTADSHIYENGEDLLALI